MVNYASRLVLFLGVALAASFLCLSPATVRAQTVSGTILGIVQDQQGGAIGKADVTARSLDTGAIRKAISEDNGEYRITSVLAGSYEISITAPGFKTEVRSGIAVTVGADVGVNFAMTVGAVNEKVEVTAEAPQVDTSSSGMGGFVNSTTIRELPLNGRDWLQLALLQPGALANAGEYQADTSRTQRGNGLAISISGGRVTENVFRIDGLVVNDYANAGPGSTLHVNMGVDAIREFSVLTNNYSAEYGRGASGVVNAITKSGTNGFHGSAYYFHRNSALDARNFFDGKKIAPFHRHQYGGAVGGPIRKDKTFFFTNYEALTEAKGQSTSTDTLSAANTVLGGWQVGGIYTRQSGGHYNVKITTDRAFTGSAVVGATQGGQRPDYLGNVPGCSPSDVTTGDIGHLIKTSCFAFPAAGTLGNLGRDLFHMPVFRDLDFSIFKNQNLSGEKLKMQFRAEMFNILNNTNLTAQTFTNTFTNTGALVSSFGTPTAPTANQSRQIQFGLRLLF